MSFCFEHMPWMVLFALVTLGTCAQDARAQLLDDDERHIRWSQEDSVSRYHRGAGPAPVTVATEGIEQSERLMTLDDDLELRPRP